MQRMTISRRYPGARVTEAIIDLHVKLPESATLLALERYCVEQAASFPSKMVVNLANGQITFGSESPASARTRPVGFLCVSADEKRFLEIRLDGFKMNHLPPYAGWESFRDEARRLWAVYREAVRPRQITRVGVRYVNRIDLPLPVEMKDYLRTSPEVSTKLPQELEGFFMQLKIPQRDIKSRLLLTEATGEPSAPNVASIILDIDLFRVVDIPFDEEEVWGLLDRLNIRNCDILEACVTERFRELIRPCQSS